MRTVRWMTSGLALVALLPAIGAAQSSRLFNNSWFWGAKAGLMSYSTTTHPNATAPSVGIDWLITRSKAALYVSGDEAFFNSTSVVQDRSPTPNLFRVGIKDMQRVTMAALAFPVAWGTIRPYGGIGFAMNLIQHVALIDQSADPQQAAVVNAEVGDQKDRISFISMAGVQGQYKRVSLFGQVLYMPAKANFLLNGRTTYMIEGGVRYNIGSSIDKTY